MFYYNSDREMERGNTRGRQKHRKIASGTYYITYILSIDCVDCLGFCIGDSVAIVQRKYKILILVRKNM